METPRRVVGSLGSPYTRDARTAIPARLVLRPQRVVGNREVASFLRPKPMAQPLAQTLPPKLLYRLCAGGAAGAVAGAGLSVVQNLSIRAAAACALAGLIVGACSAWITRNRASSNP